MLQLVLIWPDLAHAVLNFAISADLAAQCCAAAMRTDIKTFGPALDSFARVAAAATADPQRGTTSFCRALIVALQQVLQHQPGMAPQLGALLRALTAVDSAPVAARLASAAQADADPEPAMVTATDYTACGPGTIRSLCVRLQSSSA